MVACGFTITRAVQSQPWPVASAALEYAGVWGSIGRVRDEVPRISDGAPVKRISALPSPVAGSKATLFGLMQMSIWRFKAALLSDWASSLNLGKRRNGLTWICVTQKCSSPT